MNETDIGTQILKELVQNLVIMNKNAEVTRDLLVQMRDLMEDTIASQEKLQTTLDELAGHGDVLSAAVGILSDVAGNGKRLTMSDFLHAYAEAEKEVFNEDDGPGSLDEEDEEEAR